MCLDWQKAGKGLAPAVPRIPVVPCIDADLCSLGRLAASDCAHCAEVCPTGALTVGPDGLDLAAAACTACGGCAASCPQRAIVLEGILPLPPVRVARGGRARLACPMRRSGSLCLQALGLEGLARLWLSGLRLLAVDIGDCAACANGGHLAFETHLETLNALLASRGLPLLGVVRHHDGARSWPMLADPADRPGARRALFGALVRTAHPGTRPSALAQVQALPARGGPALFAWSPDIRAEFCTGCNACTRVCPTAALTLVNAEADHSAYGYDPGACVNCRLCENVCETDAIRIDTLAPARPALPLDAFRCAACGAPWHVPQGRARADGLCPVCARTRHHSRLFVVIP